MSDQQPEFKWTNWSENFQFTRIFQTFKMATHPGKLSLALVGVILTVLWGCVLDLVWDAKHQPLTGEVHAFWQVPDINQWREQNSQINLQNLHEIYDTILPGKKPKKLKDNFEDNPNKTVNKAMDKLVNKYENDVADADDETITKTAQIYKTTYFKLKSLKPAGIFGSFVSYQQGMCHRLFDAACTLNLTGQLNNVISGRYHWNVDPTRAVLEDMGVVSCLILMARGTQWMITQHLLFFLLFGLVTLAIWSIVGGALCRIAALHFARDERLSSGDALAFAKRKFLALFTAPLLPIAFIVLIGLLLIVGGLLGATPWVGELFAGITMGLALIGGFAMALAVIGLIAGGNLLWPTIAVEGSDGFDAMSRGFSYVLNKPWRTIFYALVATIYGALCYMFVRFFTFIMLKATRFFVGIGMAITDRPGTGIPNGSRLDSIWPMPIFGNFRSPTTPFGMEYWDAAGAFLIGIWLLLVVGLIAAFLVSFYFSGSTIIYYLLRRQVDATDIEDVYLEEELETEPTEITPTETQAEDTDISDSQQDDSDDKVTNDG